jgi:hypothetical protein
VIAVGAAEILLIQVKRTKGKTPSAIFPKRFIAQLLKATAPISYVVRKQLWTWVDRNGWHILDIDTVTGHPAIVAHCAIGTVQEKQIREKCDG